MDQNTAMKKHDVRSPLVGNRFVVFTGDAFRIARLNRDGKGRNYNVRVGKSPFPTLEEAVKRLSGQATLSPSMPTVEVIKRHLAKSGALVASHLYGDTFVITKPSVNTNGWQHYKAKVTQHGIEVEPKAYANRGAALVQAQRDGGPKPTLDLSKLPARPLGLYS